MDSKNVISQLIKIARNQQKIINKLAQQAGLTGDATQASISGAWDVSYQIADLLSKIPEAVASKAGVQTATLGNDGFLDVRIKFPSVSQMGNPTAAEALNKLKEVVSQATLRDPSGKPTAVSQQNVVATYG